MIACAHDEGFSVMAHANGEKTVRAALAGGVDSIEHGAYLTDETLCQLAESHAVWVPTLVTIGNLIGCGEWLGGGEGVFDLKCPKLSWNLAKVTTHNVAATNVAVFAKFYNTGFRLILR